MLTFKTLKLLLIYLLTTPQTECLCFSLAVYNWVKKLSTGEYISVLGQKKSATQRRVGVLQIAFWVSGKYTQVLRFLHRTRKLSKFSFYIHQREIPYILSWKANKIEIKGNIMKEANYNSFAHFILFKSIKETPA